MGRYVKCDLNYLVLRLGLPRPREDGLCYLDGVGTTKYFWVDLAILCKVSFGCYIVMISLSEDSGELGCMVDCLISYSVEFSQFNKSTTSKQLILKKKERMPRLGFALDGRSPYLKVVEGQICFVTSL